MHILTQFASLVHRQTSHILYRRIDNSLTNERKSGNNRNRDVTHQIRRSERRDWTKATVARGILQGAVPNPALRVAPGVNQLHAAQFGGVCNDIVPYPSSVMAVPVAPIIAVGNAKFKAQKPHAAVPNQVCYFTNNRH
jgi:hypothetical protein